MRPVLPPKIRTAIEQSEFSFDHLKAYVNRVEIERSQAAAKDKQQEMEERLREQWGLVGWVFSPGRTGWSSCCSFKLEGKPLTLHYDQYGMDRDTMHSSPGWACSGDDDMTEDHFCLIAALKDFLADYPDQLTEVLRTITPKEN